MNYKMIGRFIAQILSIEGVFMIPALCISMGYGQWNAAASFAAAMAAIVAVAAVLFLSATPMISSIHQRLTGRLCDNILSEDLLPVPACYHQHTFGLRQARRQSALCSQNNDRLSCRFLHTRLRLSSTVGS